jgi:hypothetical protein
VTVRITLAVATLLSLLALLVGCTSAAEPELPPSSDIAAVAGRITGPDGQEFLRDITYAAWDDQGRRAAELLAWIPQTAQSSDPVTAERAGTTAHAVAAFLADERETIVDAPANPRLWQAFADGLIPYLGAMVGDERGIDGFEPLDGLESQMPRTLSLFAAIATRTEADDVFTAAASERATLYEAAFAKSAVAEPMMADRWPAQHELLRAARLRGLLAGAQYLVNPDSGRPMPFAAQTKLAFEVASLTARPGDPHINAEFFDDGRLRPPSDIPDTEWSIYDSQLTVFLASWPRINDAVQQFGRTFSLIATT